MKTLFLFFAACTMLFVSCDGKMSVKAYNDDIVRTHELISQQFITTVTAIKNNPEAIDVNKANLTHFKTTLDSAINHVQGLKAPDVAKDLQASMLDLYTTIKTADLPQLDKVLACKPSSDEYVDAWNKCVNSFNAEAAKEETMIKTQEDFAAKANLEMK